VTPRSQVRRPTTKPQRHPNPLRHPSSQFGSCTVNNYSRCAL